MAGLSLRIGRSGLIKAVAVAGHVSGVADRAECLAIPDEAVAQGLLAPNGTACLPWMACHLVQISGDSHGRTKSDAVRGITPVRRFTQFGRLTQFGRFTQSAVAWRFTSIATWVALVVGETLPIGGLGENTKLSPLAAALQRVGVGIAAQHIMAQIALQEVIACEVVIGLAADQPVIGQLTIRRGETVVWLWSMVHGAGLLEVRIILRM
jgi:hypothetical protein